MTNTLHNGISQETLFDLGQLPVILGRATIDIE